MGFLDRMSTVVQAKMNKIMEQDRGPQGDTGRILTKSNCNSSKTSREAWQRSQPPKKRLELQKAKLQMSIDKLDAQAKEALQAGREGSWPAKLWRTKPH